MKHIPQIIIIANGPHQRRDAEDRLQLIEREPMWRFECKVRWAMPAFEDLLFGSPRRMTAILDPLAIADPYSLRIAAARDHEIYSGWRECDNFLAGLCGNIIRNPWRPPAFEGVPVRTDPDEAFHDTVTTGIGLLFVPEPPKEETP